MPMLGRLLLSAGMALSLLFSSGTCAQAENDPKSVVDTLITTKANSDFLRERFAAIADFRINEQRTGLFLTTGAVPGSGRLLIRRAPNDKTDSCSGVVIAPGWFLTAAHCVCKLNDGHAKTSAQCSAQLSELQLEVFLPREGLFSATSAPFVHPDYNSPAYLTPSAVGDLKQIAAPIADLALIRFPENKEYVGFQESYEQAKRLLVSYGTLYFAIEEYALAMGFEVGRPIAPGLGQASRLQDLHRSREDCGRYHAADSLCSRYSAMLVEAGPLQDSTVCQGDSGGSVLSRAPDGRWSVLAVVSFFSPPNPFDRCDGATAGRRTHYTDVSLYREWIRAVVGATKKSGIHQTCVDALFKSGTFDLLGFKGLVSAATVNKRQSDNTRRSTIEAFPAATCSESSRFGVAACRAAAPTYVRINIESDFAQVTICDGEANGTQP